jgi:hypothetical protein
MLNSLGSGLGRNGEQTGALTAALLPIRSETALTCTDVVGRMGGYVCEAEDNACPTGSGKSSM